MLLLIVNALLTVYVGVLFVRIGLSWLIAFNVINQFNPAVRALDDFSRTLTEPVLRPIRRFMPDLGGLDISPVVVLLGIQVVRILLDRGLN